MDQIPSNRYIEPKHLRALLEKCEIMGLIPTPAKSDRTASELAERFRLDCIQVRDEIDRQPELMRALPHTRFARSLGEKPCLPTGVAEGLEDFEAGLRAAGLIAVDEVLMQSYSLPLKFRAQKVKVVNRKKGHAGSIDARRRVADVERAINSAVEKHLQGDVSVGLTARLMHSKKGAKPAL